jgi:hypothetical protein
LPDERGRADIFEHYLHGLKLDPRLPPDRLAAKVLRTKVIKGNIGAFEKHAGGVEGRRRSEPRRRRRCTRLDRGVSATHAYCHWVGGVHFETVEQPNAKTPGPVPGLVTELKSKLNCR